MAILFFRLMLLFPGIFPGTENPHFPFTLFYSRYHPLHVSTTDISFNAQDKQLEVVCTIFTDDFESALAARNQGKADLSAPAMHAAMDQRVRKYMEANVALNVSGKAVALSYVGFEKASESVNVYLESKPVLAPKKLEARISILYDLYDDQMNIVHMTVGGKRKSTKLDYPDKVAVQVF